VKLKLALLAIMQEDGNQEPCHSFRLQEPAFLKCGGSNEVATVSSVSANGSSHIAPQRLKPLLIWPFIATLKRLRHPKAKSFFLISELRG